MQKPDNDFTRLPGAGRMARYTTWNLLGMSLPMVAALFAIPLLLDGLGKERFGALSLVWMLVGYFSVFDFGLGRALTKMTAEKLGQGRADLVPGLFWTSMLMMALIGLAGAALTAALTPWLVHGALKITPALQAEALASFYVVAAGLPVVVTTVGLIGMLEAHREFGLLNAIRLPMGLFTFLGPVCVLPFSNNLAAIVAVLIAGRLLICALYFVASLRVNPALRHQVGIDVSLVHPLLTFGGWMTVSNILQPLMIHVDRLLVGAIVSVTDVSWYATCTEVVVKLLIVPRSWVSVLFPSFASHYGRDPAETAALFSRSVKYLGLALFPAALLIVSFSHEGLRLWLGEDFAAHSFRVMQWLTVGMFIYSLSFVPFSFLQSIGRPDLSARIHLVEFPLYLAAAWLLIRAYGIEGAAIAWVARAAVDVLLMFGFSRRFLPGPRRSLGRGHLALAASLVALAAAALLPGAVLHVAAAAVFLTLWGLVGWFILLSCDERKVLLQFLPAPWKRCRR